MRIAWFSPYPPSTSGIAAYSAELLLLLRARHTIDVFLDHAPQLEERGNWSAHDFVWKHRRAPYDLTVYQLGNASCHDYMWAYLFRYPGLVILHDAQLHQARALWLTKRWKPRTADYLAEFQANHPTAPPSVGLLVAAGLGGSLYHHWPLVKLVLEAARLSAVHNRRVMLDLSHQYPNAAIDAIEMGVQSPSSDPAGRGGQTVDVRARHSIPADAVVIAAFGGITREKRIPELLAAVGSVAAADSRVHVLLVGAEATHYDVRGDIRAHVREDRVHLAGFVPDADLPAYLAASDVCSCLRWPTNRETSASWLRCLSAAKATIVSDLTHLTDVPTVDPRDWRVLAAGLDDGEPVAVSIDLLDEQHSLRLALARLTAEPLLRRRLGRAARAWWEAHHRLEPMAEAYERLFTRATALNPPTSRLPPHLVADVTATTRALLAPFGLEEPRFLFP
ncbi:MAG: glycosyltransferase [Vicinamibacterales bacterium]